MKKNWRGLRIKFTSAIANFIPLERIERSILLIRGHKVTLSTELANLYHVELRALIHAIKRTPHRFPDDFLFQLSAEERELEIKIGDFKLGWRPHATLRLHRTRYRHAFQRSEQ